jgi:hypothetical protein
MIIYNLFLRDKPFWSRHRTAKVASLVALFTGLTITVGVLVVYLTSSKLMGMFLSY